MAAPIIDSIRELVQELTTDSDIFKPMPWDRHAALRSRERWNMQLRSYLAGRSFPQDSYERYWLLCRIQSTGVPNAWSSQLYQPLSQQSTQQQPTVFLPPPPTIQQTSQMLYQNAFRESRKRLLESPVLLKAPISLATPKRIKSGTEDQTQTEDLLAISPSTSTRGSLHITMAGQEASPKEDSIFKDEQDLDMGISDQSYTQQFRTIGTLHGSKTALAVQTTRSTEYAPLDGLVFSSDGSSILAYDDYRARGLTEVQVQEMPKEVRKFFDEDGFVTKDLLGKHQDPVPCYFDCGHTFGGYTRAVLHTIFPRCLLISRAGARRIHQNSSKNNPYFWVQSSLWPKPDVKTFSTAFKATPCPKTSGPTQCLWSDSSCPVGFKTKSQELFKCSGFGMSQGYEQKMKQLFYRPVPKVCNATSGAWLIDMWFHLLKRDLGFPCRCGILWASLYDFAGHCALDHCKQRPLSRLESVAFFLGHREALGKDDLVGFRLFQPTDIYKEEETESGAPEQKEPEAAPSHKRSTRSTASKQTALTDFFGGFDGPRDRLSDIDNESEEDEGNENEEDEGKESEADDDSDGLGVEDSMLDRPKRTRKRGSKKTISKRNKQTVQDWQPSDSWEACFGMAFHCIWSTVLDSIPAGPLTIYIDRFSSTVVRKDAVLLWKDKVKKYYKVTDTSHPVLQYRCSNTGSGDALILPGTPAFLNHLPDVIGEIDGPLRYALGSSAAIFDLLSQRLVRDRNVLTYADSWTTHPGLLAWACAHLEFTLWAAITTTGIAAQLTAEEDPTADEFIQILRSAVPLDASFRPCSAYLGEQDGYHWLRFSSTHLARIFTGMAKDPLAEAYQLYCSRTQGWKGHRANLGRGVVFNAEPGRLGRNTRLPKDFLKRLSVSFEEAGVDTKVYDCYV